MTHSSTKGATAAAGLACDRVKLAGSLGSVEGGVWAHRGHDQALKEPGEAPRRRSLRSLGSELEPAMLSYGGPHYR